MRRFRKQIYSPWRVLLCGLVVALLYVGLHPVQASADIRQDVVIHRPVNIPKGEITDEVLVFGSDAIVSGRVTDTLVVVNGNVHLTSTARTGIVIDLGGQITQDPGSRAEAVYSISFQQPFLNSLLVGSALVLAVWAMRLAISVTLIVCPVALAFIFRSRLERPVSYMEKSLRRSALTGVFASVVFLALSSVVAITIIGLPIAAILLLLYAMLGLLGFSCVSVWLGRMVNLRGVHDPPVWMKALVGAAFIVAFGNIPVVGPILLAVLWLVGIGAVTTWLWQRWKARKRKGTTLTT
jgi:hypothetical protein